MQLVIDRELANYTGPAVEKLAGVLNMRRETVRVVDVPSERRYGSEIPVCAIDASGT